MSRASRIVSAVVAGLAASSLMVASAPASQAASRAGGAPAWRAAASAGWRIVFSKHYPAKASRAYSGYGAVVVPGPHDAWVFGGSCTCGAGRPEGEHWNGQRWTAVTFPAGLTGSIVAASAPSASDIWVASDVSGWVLHWNGSRWSVALRLKESGGYPSDFTGVTAFSSRDVWVFGGVIDGDTGLVGFGTWHFNGTTWTKVKGAGRNIVQASALSASDIWGVGGYDESSDGVQHFDGTTWQGVGVPGSVGTERAVLAVSPSDVWVDGQNVNTSKPRPTLIRWDGTGWQQVAVDAPPGADLLYQISPDGYGGIWIEAESSSSGRFWMLHRTAAGDWTATALPVGSPIGDYALVPGTHSLWGGGWSADNDGSNATIWAYGPVG